MRYIVAWITVIGIWAGVSCAEAQFDPIAPDAGVDQVLDALKSRGDQLHDFSGDVKITHEDTSTADSNTDGGTVVFQKLDSGDSRIRVNFTNNVVGDKNFPKHHEYMLADGWLRERDYDKKVENDRQVVRPGEKVNLMKLGDGPFPLPIGQDREEVKKQFDVTKIAAARNDPAGTVHLKLVPKPGSEFEQKFQQIDVWANRSDGMPVRIMTADKSGDSTQTTDLSNLHLNAGVKDDEFVLPEVHGWTVTQDPYQQ